MRAVRPAPGADARRRLDLPGAGIARTTVFVDDQTAGTSDTVRVWAYDPYGNVNSRYSGGADLTGGVMSTSPGCAACGGS